MMPRKVLFSMVGLMGMPTSCVVWASTVEAPRGGKMVLPVVLHAWKTSGEVMIGSFPHVVDPTLSLSSSASCCPRLRDPNVGENTEGRAMAVFVGALAFGLREINPLPFSGTLSDVALASSS